MKKMIETLEYLLDRIKAFELKDMPANVLESLKKSDEALKAVFASEAYESQTHESDMIRNLETSWRLFKHTKQMRARFGDSSYTLTTLMALQNSVEELRNTLSMLEAHARSATPDTSKKYSPQSREELKVLVRDENVYLGDIDISQITDLSRLFQCVHGGGGVNAKTLAA
ncbi:hypothetical protein [Helicobacter salomonis]|uniref:hypothetical protein n=1 Tax=Helicobacter salomonis TaxID=56878 RepID=UPI000CF162A5|nr:hypothetical protein [Helicobacter salomonis]